MYERQLPADGGSILDQSRFQANEPQIKKPLMKKTKLKKDKDTKRKGMSFSFRISDFEVSVAIFTMTYRKNLFKCLDVSSIFDLFDRVLIEKVRLFKGVSLNKDVISAVSSIPLCFQRLYCIAFMVHQTTVMHRR